MDLKSILKSRNLDDAQIDTLLTNPAYATILESFVKEAEDGKTAYQKAQEVEQNLKTWNETQVVPYVREADEKVAKTNAELAALKTHMKTLKDRGYDIPDAYLEASSTPVTPKSEPTSTFDPSILDKRAMEIAETNMALMDLNTRHRKLTGNDLELTTEYEDFKANKRPQETLRTYIARKYDHDTLSKSAAQAAEQKRLDEYAATKVAEEKAKWTQNNGVNPETRSPRASRWDAISKEPERAQLWQTKAGRQRATEDRLQKYSVQ